MRSIPKTAKSRGRLYLFFHVDEEISHELQRNFDLCIPRKGIARPQSHFSHSHWDCSRAVPFLGIFVSNFRYCVFAVCTQAAAFGRNATLSCEREVIKRNTNINRISVGVWRHNRPTLKYKCFQLMRWSPQASLNY